MVEADREFAAEHRDALDRLLEVGGGAPVAEAFEPGDPEVGVGPEPELLAEALTGFERGRPRSAGPERDRSARIGADEGDPGAGLGLGADVDPGPEGPGQ